MSIAQSLTQSAKACEGAAIALAHSLRRSANAPEAPNSILETYREAEAFAITVRAVIDEAEPILPLLAKEANCVGKGEALIQGKVRNGFDTIASVLEALLDTSVDAILDVGGNLQRWLVSPMQKAGGFERMATHHGQLRAMYGLLHLAAKIVRAVDVKETLFFDASESGILRQPGNWRSAIKLDDFYGRYFGFHYKPEMRNLLRVVNIARGSVHKSHEEDGGNALIKNVTMLGWGWVYSNMVLMNTLGFGVEGADQIGVDAGKMSVSELRKFMNLVEEPIVAGVSGLASADIALDRSFAIPIPGEEGGLEGIESGKHSLALKEVLKSIEDPVRARIMSFRQRPLNLPKQQRSKRPQRNTTGQLKSPKEEYSSPETRGAKKKAECAPKTPTKTPPKATELQPNDVTPPSRAVIGTKEKVVVNSETQIAPVTVSNMTEKSYLASTIKTEFLKLQTNVSSFLGLEAAKPASGLILHFHGGGFVSQSSESHAIYMREWCAELEDAILLSIDYKLAPEHKFPTAVHECVYAYLWALQNAERIGCKCERVVFAGDSAGGNLAIATAFKVLELGMRNADGICIAYPALYVSLAWSPSRLLSFFDPLLPMTVLELCLKSYLPHGEIDKGRTCPLLSPMVASADLLRKLPQTSIVCGGLDPLLDDAVVFIDRLTKAGRKGDVLRVFETMPHGFLNLNLVNETAREGMRFMAQRIAVALGVDQKEEVRNETVTNGSLNL